MSNKDKKIDGLKSHRKENTSKIFFGRIFTLRLRCFDTVFQRPYRYFSIALKVAFSLSDGYKIFTSNWLQIEICENVVLSKIDITMASIKQKTLKLIKAEHCEI